MRPVSRVTINQDIKTFLAYREVGVRTELETRDPAKAWAFLEGAYGAQLRITSEPGSVRSRHLDLGRVFVNDLELAMGVRGDMDDFEWLTVVEVLEGWVEIEVNGARHRLGPGDVLPVSAPGYPFRAVTSPRFRERVVGVRPDALDRAARDRGRHRADLRLGVIEPLRGPVAVPWRALIDYLSATERAHPETFTGPLAASAVAHLAAHTALSLFDGDTWAEVPEIELGRDQGDGREVAVRRAIAFIEEAADTDITLVDIAAAAHVTPRALQYGFRRLLDTTPMAHLRRVRLQHVRAELLDAAPGTTVAQVAGRWGFYHLGRFAGYYRGEFGENPAQTLDS